MRALVRRAGVPDEVRAAVVEAYSRLGADAAVAVRSSATSEDTGATSFAGMHETYTNVVGEAALLAAPGGLLGVGVRAAGARLSQRRGYARGADDRGGRAAHGRLGALGGDVHRGPGVG
jgi:hypothetical protein